MDLTVADVRVKLLSVPFADPPKTGFLALPAIDLVVVEVETRDGVVGTGHLHPLAGGMRTLACCIEEMLAPLVIGADASDPPAIWKKMWRATFTQGRMGVTVMGMSALDVALWDALGRARQTPLWKLWGGERRAFKTYGSGCYRGLGREGMIEKAQRFRARGFEAIKMQVSHLFTPDEDVANVRAMREALGDDALIMIDVNQGWDAETAIATGRRLDDFHPFWLEEPVMADDLDGYAAVSAGIRTPVVTGENHFLAPDLKPFVDRRLVPILQPDVMRGGYTGLFEIARIAEPAGISIAPHMFPELMTHLVAALPNRDWLEWMGWYDHLWVEPIPVEAGTMTPPDRPGHGMDFLPELFA
ncbi:MAG: mandelate racemase/muconate lactonizing enzyme family protein, partial [Pseudomonadota bacterium]